MYAIGLFAYEKSKAIYDNFATLKVYSVMWLLNSCKSKKN